MALNKVSESGSLGVPEWHATSVKDFDSWIEVLSKGNKKNIFRGQRKYWPLLPRVTNSGYRGRILENEKELLHYFKMDGARCLHVAPASDWDWLFVAQHHALPTKLLDCMYNQYRRFDNGKESGSVSTGLQFI